MNYAGNLQVTSQNCNCYPHLFRCSQLKYHKLLSTFVERPLCCLAFHHILRCSVFKVQTSGSFEARSQNPIPWVLRSNSKLELVGPSGLEPPTLRLSVVRSSQLSYGPIFQSTQYVPSKLNNARKKRSDLGMLHKAYGLVRSP